VDASVGSLDAPTVDASGSLDSGDSEPTPSQDAVPGDVGEDRIAVQDAAMTPTDAGPVMDGATPFDVDPMPDVSSHTDAGLPDEGTCSPSGTYQRSCACTDASLLLVTACGPGAEGTCWVYTSSCTDTGFVVCGAPGYALDATLRARCEEFCTMVRASDPSSSCPF